LLSTKKFASSYSKCRRPRSGEGWFTIIMTRGVCVYDTTLHATSRTVVLSLFVNNVSPKAEVTLHQF